MIVQIRELQDGEIVTVTQSGEPFDIIIKINTERFSLHQLGDALKLSCATGNLIIEPRAGNVIIVRGV